MPFAAWMDVQMHWNIILQHVHRSTCQDIILKKPDSLNSDLLYIITQLCLSFVVSKFYLGICTPS